MSLRHRHPSLGRRSNTIAPQCALFKVTVPNTPVAKTISLDCWAGHVDVAQTLCVKNTTNAAIPSGTKIYWTLNGLMGSFTFQTSLGKGKTLSELARPGKRRHLQGLLPHQGSTLARSSATAQSSCSATRTPLQTLLSCATSPSRR